MSTTKPREMERVQAIIARISMNLFGTKFTLKLRCDAYGAHKSYLQVSFEAPCTKTGEMTPWKGRKWYLSDYMTDSEIVNTGYCAFKAAIEHEMMESYKVDGIVLFNPHINFETLLRVSHEEVTRD